MSPPVLLTRQALVAELLGAWLSSELIVIRTRAAYLSAAEGLTFVHAPEESPRWLRLQMRGHRVRLPSERETAEVASPSIVLGPSFESLRDRLTRILGARVLPRPVLRRVPWNGLAPSVAFLLVDHARARGLTATQMDLVAAHMVTPSRSGVCQLLQISSATYAERRRAAHRRVGSFPRFLVEVRTAIEHQLCPLTPQNGG